jgi:hypothetical protein
VVECVPALGLRQIQQELRAAVLPVFTQSPVVEVFLQMLIPDLFIARDRARFLVLGDEGKMRPCPEVRDPHELRLVIEFPQLTELRLLLLLRKVADRLTGRAKAGVVFITKLDRLLYPLALFVYTPISKMESIVSHRQWSPRLFCLRRFAFRRAFLVVGSKFLRDR